MIGKTLALVRRALRVDARDLRSHLFRGALAAVILMFLAMIQLESGVRSAGGLTFFTSVAILNYVFITLAGASFFASAITEEKEERTLALLKMANIGPLALLLGKWIPRLYAAGFLIGIQIPFTILAITMGGVLWNQVTAIFLCLLAHLFLVGNLGLFCSVVMRRTTTASGLAVILLLAFHFLPPMLEAFVALSNYSSGRTNALGDGLLAQVVHSMMAATGYMRMMEVLNVSFADPPYTLDFHFISNMAAGGVLFLLSWLLLNPCTRNDIEADAGGAVWTRTLLGSRKRAPRRAWDSAIVWKDFQQLAGGTLGFRLRLVVYTVVILGFSLVWVSFDYTRMEFEEIGGFAVMITMFMLHLEIPFATTRAFRAELSDKTWSTLTLLPRSLPEIAYAKLIGSLFSLLPCLIWLLLGAAFLFDDTMQMLKALFSDGEVFLGLFFYLTQYFLAVHLATWLSVSFRWAMWPVAIFLAGFIVIMGLLLLMTCLTTGVVAGGSGSEEVMLFLVSSVTLIPIGVLHVQTGMKLAALAAEE